MDAIKEINAEGSETGKTSEKVKIVTSGVVE